MPTVPTLIVSIAITAFVYSLFPLLYANLRKKPITARKYRVFCFLFNFLIMVFFIALNGSSSGSPYYLWTWVFSSLGKNILEERYVLMKPNAPTEAPASDLSTVSALERTEKFQQFTVPVPAPAKNKKDKNRFCKLCGSPIDPTTKKCTSCGKQYFRLPSLKKSGLVPKTMVILSLLVVGLCIYRNVQYQDQIGTLNAIISEMESQQASDEALISDLRKKNAGNSSKVYTLSQQVEKMQRVYDFCDRYIVVVLDNGTRKYHKCGCYIVQFRNSAFWGYNIDAAKQQGFQPCQYCFN